MNKKDRIAIVITLALVIMSVIDIVGTSGMQSPIWAIISLPILFIYWGYRFIKNDISFLKVKE